MLIHFFHQGSKRFKSRLLRARYCIVPTKKPKIYLNALKINMFYNSYFLLLLLKCRIKCNFILRIRHSPLGLTFYF